MKHVAIIQARMSSNRLPGKVLMDIAGRPLLSHVIERANSANVFDEVLVATSEDPSDDIVASYCRFHSIPLYRGSLMDVLARYFHAAKSREAEVVTRLTADCPLLDPDVVRSAVEMFQEGDFDYVSNAIERTYPDGLDTEVFHFKALEEAHREAQHPHEREHVTPFIHDNPQRYHLGHLKHDENLAHHRWTVDEPGDLEFVRKVYGELGGGVFGMREVMEVIGRSPEMARLDTHVISSHS